ncbi:MAG: hypothetical protein WB677_11300 [Xanthobacteraceae bacterium]
MMAPILCSGSRHHVLSATFFAAALVFAPLPSSATKMVPRSGEKSCREAVNGLITLLDAKTDNTALYRDTYGIVVNTCGLVSPAPKPKDPPLEHDPEKWKPVFREDHAPAKSHRDACHDLAAALVDLIEDGKLNTAAFVKARDDVALACPPR